MKRSQIATLSTLFFLATSLTVPTVSIAGTSDLAGNQKSILDTDPQSKFYNTPNLNKQDGFDESEHRRKIQQKPKNKQKPAETIPLNKHNL